MGEATTTLAPEEDSRARGAFDTLVLEGSASTVRQPSSATREEARLDRQRGGSEGSRRPHAGRRIC
jgi:hypothetical protein